MHHPCLHRAGVGTFMHHSEPRFLSFSAHCSSIASLDIIFHHHIYLYFTLVAVAVRKTCLSVPHSRLLRYVDALSDNTKNDFIRVRRLFKKWTRAL